jgi:hypothetical protein
MCGLPPRVETYRGRTWRRTSHFHGRHLQADLAKLLRNHLRAVGLEAERPELFSSTENRLRMRGHDLRGTFADDQPRERPYGGLGSPTILVTGPAR